MLSIYKRLKIWVLAMMANMLVAVPVMAQFTDSPTASPQERAEVLTNWMVENLKLEDAQLKQVKNINLNAANKMEAAKKEFGKDLEGFIKRGQEIDREHNIALRDALTPRQWSNYQKMRDGTKFRNEGREEEGEIAGHGAADDGKKPSK